jgi:hypothetical protein
MKIPYEHLFIVPEQDDADVVESGIGHENTLFRASSTSSTISCLVAAAVTPRRLSNMKTFGLTLFDIIQNRSVMKEIDKIVHRIFIGRLSSNSNVHITIQLFPVLISSPILDYSFSLNQECFQSSSSENWLQRCMFPRFSRWQKERIGFASRPVFVKHVTAVPSTSSSSGDTSKRRRHRRSCSVCFVSSVISQTTASGTTSNGTVDIVLFTCVPALDACLIVDKDIRWTTLIAALIWRRAYLQAAHLKCATLGAAYASMSRDRGSVMNATRARQFAEHQLWIARRLGDQQLERKAWIYISYYHMFMGRFRRCRRILDAILLARDSRNDDEEEEEHGDHDSVNDMAHAAMARLNLLLLHRHISPRQ